MNERTTGTVKTMTTNEIIQDLRDKAGVEGKTTLGNLLEQAADRLEELDERVTIMMEGNRVEIVMDGKNILDLYSTQITKVLEK